MPLDRKWAKQRLDDVRHKLYDVGGEPTSPAEHYLHEAVEYLADLVEALIDDGAEEGGGG